MTEDIERTKRLQMLAGELGALVAFADEEEEFVLTAKLEDARVLFETRHGRSTR